MHETVHLGLQNEPRPLNSPEPRGLDAPSCTGRSDAPSRSSMVQSSNPVSGNSGPRVDRRGSARLARPRACQVRNLRPERRADRRAVAIVHRAAGAFHAASPGLRCVGSDRCRSIASVARLSWPCSGQRAEPTGRRNGRPVLRTWTGILRRLVGCGHGGRGVARHVRVARIRMLALGLRNRSVGHGFKDSLRVQRRLVRVSSS